MFIGINMGIVGSLMGGASILALFASGEVGVWFDPTDITTLYQDINGTTPVTAPGQTCALMKDKSGRNNHATQPTAAQRPTYGVIPYGGVRNLANGSGAVSDVNYWPAGATVNGVTYTKLASGVDTDGLPYVDISVVGTASATAFSDVYAFSNSRIAAAVGQTFTTSVLVKVISGTVPPAGCGAVVGVVGETVPSTVTETFISTQFAPTVETLASLSATLVNAASNQARLAAYIRTSPGATVNYTIRIKGLQFEKAAARSAFQLNLSKYNVTEAGKASLGVLYPDGIDDWMVTPSINFSGTDKVTIWAGLQKMSDAAQALLAELSVSTGGNPNTFGLQAATPNPATFRFVSAGSATGSGIAEIAGYPATTVAVITGIGDISAPKASIIVNNSATVTSAVSQGTGNYSNNPIYLFRRGGASLPFNGIFTGLIVRGAASSAAQISNVNAFLNSELGAY